MALFGIFELVGPLLLFLRGVSCDATLHSDVIFSNRQQNGCHWLNR